MSGTLETKRLSLCNYQSEIFKAITIWVTTSKQKDSCLNAHGHQRKLEIIMNLDSLEECTWHRKCIHLHHAIQLLSKRTWQAHHQNKANLQNYSLQSKKQHLSCSNVFPFTSHKAIKKSRCPHYHNIPWSNHDETMFHSRVSAKLQHMSFVARRSFLSRNAISNLPSFSK